MVASIITPRQLLIGGGAIAQLPALLESLGLARPLVVTDPHLVEIGKLAQLAAILDGASIAWQAFSEVVEDPTDVSVDAGLACFRAGDYDCIVALGGGSSIDTGKAMAIMAVSEGHIRQYRVPAQADVDPVPMIAIPTTAGTGSEVTRFMVITDTEKNEKLSIGGRACVPIAAIVDYLLTYTVCFRTTADTGIDSLTHAIEAYVGRKANPITDGWALAAMTRLARNIRRACEAPEDPVAREQMMLGAMQGGMAFSNASVALVHGMSRPIGAFFHVAHGLSNAMLLPAITAFSAGAALGRYADCARAMGLCGEEVGDQAAVAVLLEELKALNRELEVPTPRVYGIDRARYRELIPVMAEQALASGSPGNNPKVPSAEEIATLYEGIYE
jgi:alcohol dehydrogenase class IV